jgi:exopolysaccharide production protein ExoY
VILSSRENTSDEKHGPIQIPRWKRILDLLFIVLTLPLVLPAAILIGTLIALVSPGPVLFRQERIGFRGNRFLCLKFRTMFVRAETAVHQGHLEFLMDSGVPMTKLDARGDPRIIPFGSLLRSSGLDELPQLINVLRGEMSLVGPRPCLVYEYARYRPWQTERFNTLPGLTGLWQVSGKNCTTFNQMIELDIKYARKKTLWLDLLIILKTLPVMFGQVWDSWRRRRPSVNQKNPPSHSTLQTNHLAANGIDAGNRKTNRENLERKRDGIKS